MNISKGEILTIVTVAFATICLSALHSCKKDDDSDAAADNSISALVLDLSASCDGEPCL